jgi:hypothetical protein
MTFSYFFFVITIGSTAPLKLIFYITLKIMPCQVTSGASADFRNHFFLQGLTFDLEKNCSIHVDLAKANSRPKRPRTGCILCSFMLLYYVPNCLFFIPLLLTPFLFFFCLDYDFPTSGKKSRNPRDLPDSGIIPVA